MSDPRPITPVPPNDWQALNIILDQLRSQVEEVKATVDSKPWVAADAVTIEEADALDTAEDPTTDDTPDDLYETPKGMAGYTVNITFHKDSKHAVLDWSDWPGLGDKELDGFEVYYSTGVCTPSTSTFYDKVGKTHKKKEITGLTKGVTYDFRVMPIYSWGDGTVSDAASYAVPSDLNLLANDDDPTEQGDMKLVTGTVTEISDCDQTTGWTVTTGSISLDNTTVKEGSGSLKTTVLGGASKVLTFTKASGAWDHSTMKYVKVWLNGHKNLGDITLYLGNTLYSDHDSGSLGACVGDWKQFLWDISAISPANDNNKFSIYVNNLGTTTKTLYVDYAIFEPSGPSLKIHTGDGVKTVTLT